MESDWLQLKRQNIILSSAPQIPINSNGFSGFSIFNYYYWDKMTFHLPKEGLVHLGINL